MGPTAETKTSLVICIDDDQANLVVRKLLLESAGFSALTAASGPEGLDIIRSQAVDAVVLDYSMPEMDGGIVATHIKEMKPDTPIVMLTGYMSVQAEVGQVVDAVIEKGGEPTTLIRRLATLIKVRNHSHPELGDSEYVAFMDASRSLLDCSDEVCELLGYSRSELLDKTIDELSYFAENVPSRFESYKQAGTLTRNGVLKHKSGRPIPVCYRGWVFPDGCLAGVFEPSENWEVLFQAALAEKNEASLKKRIEVALVAIHERLRDVNDGSSDTSEERKSLHDALSALHILQRSVDGTR
ncbi:MAG TPA: response regulator [Candidatus Dormibacteraeota bacterium]|nr:response regulator [Candidatus Dormibacteraeota bacterium]